MGRTAGVGDGARYKSGRLSALRCAASPAKRGGRRRARATCCGRGRRCREPCRRSGHTSCAGRRAAAGAPPSTIASDEHEVAASSPCAPRGRASRAAAAPRRSRPCRARACASGPRSRCGASTCAFASHVSMRRKRSLRTGRAGDIFGQMGRRGDNTPLRHGTQGRTSQLLLPALVCINAPEGCRHSVTSAGNWCTLVQCRQ